jgi:uncharacterized repeat protein (TIGR01451 family)
MPNQLLVLVSSALRAPDATGDPGPFPSPRSFRWAAWLAGPLLGVLSVTAQAQDVPDILVNHDGLITGTQDTAGPAGGDFTYRAKVKLNAGPDATGVTLTEVLPEGAIFQSFAYSATGMSCLPALAAGTTITAANKTITCSIGDVTNAFKWVDFNVVLPTVSSTWKAVASAALPAPYGQIDGDGGTNNVNLERNFTASDATDFGVKVTTDAPAGGVNNGDLYNYTVQVNSYGPSALPVGGYAQVTFEVPSGAPIQSMPTGTNWTCATSPAGGTFPLSTGVIVCQRTNPPTGSYGAGAPLDPIIVPVQSQMGGPIGAAVTVEGFQSAGVPMADGQKGNNTDSVIVTSVGADYTDVSLSKTASPTLLDSSNATNTVEYSLQVRRESGGLQPEDVFVTDTLPAGHTFVGFSASNDALWACGYTAPTLSCSWNGGVAYTGANNSNFPVIKFTATVPGQASGNTVANQAAVAVKPGTEPNTANNKSTATLAFSNRANLSVTKTAPQRPVKKGELFQYTIVVTNDGPMPIGAGEPISVTDSPSAALRLMSMNAAGSSAGWTCPTAPVGTAGAPVTCQNGSALAVGASLTLVLDAQVDNITGDYARFANTVTTGLLPGRDTEVVSAVANATVSEQEGDLEIFKTVRTAPASPKSGDPITYRLRVVNKASSTQTAQAVRITDVLNNLVIATDGNGTDYAPGGGYMGYSLVTSPLPTYPAGVDYPAGTTTATCGTPTGSASTRDRTLTCDIDFLAPGKEVELDVTIRPRMTTATPLATTAMDYVNTASAFSPYINDPTPADNTKPATIQLTSLVDLTVQKQVSPTTEVAAGQPATYTVTTKNLGPSSAQQVRMVDTLPTNAIMVGEPTVPDGVCTHSDGSPMNGKQGGTMICTWATPLPAGSQYVVEYSARSVGGNPAPGTTMNNRVEVSTATTESRYDNNSAQVSIGLKPPELDVQVQMSHTEDGLLAGETTEYTITVRNDQNSASYATNVNLTELFPAAGSTATFSYQGGLALAGTGTTKTGYTSGVTSGLSPALCATQPAINATSGPLSCVIPLMAPGDVVTIKFTLKAEPLTGGATTGTVFHTATVKPAETEYMPLYDALANNSTTDRTSTSTTARNTDIGVEKKGPGGRLHAGDTVTYTISVFNSGRNATTAPGTMTDVLPAALTFVSASGPGSCTTPAVGVTGTVSCVVPPMAKAQTLVYTVVAKVATPYNGSVISNTATVTLPGDEDPDNNESTTTTEPPPPPHVAIPTLSQWGLALLSLLMAVFALRRGAVRSRL